MKNPAPPDLFRVGRSATGLGLFAIAPIAAGTFIVAYEGRKLRDAVADPLRNRYLFKLGNGWTVDGAGRGNLARYINHACKPNAAARIRGGVIRIYAIKRIRTGDEITYNYGREYFEAFIEPKGCLCRSCTRKAARRALTTAGKRPRLRRGPA